MVAVVDEMRLGGREAEVFVMAACICVPTTFLRNSDDGHVLERWSGMALVSCSVTPQIDATISNLRSGGCRSYGGRDENGSGNRSRADGNIVSDALLGFVQCEMVWRHAVCVCGAHFAART